MVNGNDNSQFVAGVMHRLTQAEFAVNQACVAAVARQSEASEPMIGIGLDGICEATGYNMGMVQPAVERLHKLRVIQRSNTLMMKQVKFYRPNPNAVVIAKLIEG